MKYIVILLALIFILSACCSKEVQYDVYHEPGEFVFNPIDDRYVKIIKVDSFATNLVYFVAEPRFGTIKRTWVSYDELHWITLLEEEQKNKIQTTKIDSIQNVPEDRINLTEIP